MKRRPGHTDGHRRGGVHMPILKQATVAGDGKPTQNLDIVRRQMVQISEVADREWFIPGETNRVNYDMAYGIPAWIDLRSGQYATQALSLMSEAKMPWIFQHFGGLSCKGLANAMHFAEKFRIHGIVSTREDYSDDTTANLNVTTIHSGGMTVPNNGIKNIFAGDVIVALPPHIHDPLVLGALNATGIPNRGRRSLQDGAQHSRYTPLPHNTSYSLLRAGLAKLSGDELRTRPLQDQYDLALTDTMNPTMAAQDPIVMLGAELRLFIATAVARGVEALYVRGDVGMPTGVGGAYESHATVRLRTIGEPAGSAAAPYDILGFTPSSAGPHHVAPERVAFIRDEVVDAVFYGMEGGMSVPSVAGGPDLRIGAHPHLSAEVRAAVRNPLQRLANAIDRATASVRNVTVGRALTSAGPGGEFHLAVNAANV